MKNMFAGLARFVRSIEEAPITPTTFIATFFALITIRLTTEGALAAFQERTFEFYFFEFTHTFLFFLCSFFVILPIVRLAGAADFKRAANILLAGFTIIITPPVIDAIISHGRGFWSFYTFDSLQGLALRFVTFFGDKPDIGITYGVRIEVAITCILFGIYAYMNSKKVWKALLVSLSAYAALFMLGTFPSWITFIAVMPEKSLLSVTANDIAALFLTPEPIFTREILDFRSTLNTKMSIIYALFASILMLLSFSRSFPRYLVAVWRNIRLPQVIWHGGLLLLGIGLAATLAESELPSGLFMTIGTIVMLIAVESAWIASVVTNDLYDIRIDQKTNPSRPLIMNTIPVDTYRVIGIVFFLISILFSAIISFSGAALLLAYQALAWVYSASPFRLKRVPILATAIAASAGLLILTIGFSLISPNHDLSTLPFPILAFLFFAYAVSVPIKDFKDIEGDRADHVRTIPVILGARRAQLLIGSLVFLCYFMSPLVIGDRSIAIPALLFGSIAFWTIQRGVPEEGAFFSFRRLPGLVLAVTAIYGFLITVILFK